MKTASKNRRTVLFPVWTLLAALFCGFLLSGGCESSEGNTVEISASTRDLSAKGQTSVLTARGWNNYKWTLSDKQIGRLDRDTGGSVVYTALSIPADGAAYQNQIVTCQTTDSGDGGGAFATITLRHVSKGGAASASASTNNASRGGGSVPGSSDAPQLSFAFQA